MSKKKATAVPEIKPPAPPVVPVPVPLPKPHPDPFHHSKPIFQVVVTSDIVVTGVDANFTTTREVTWEVKAENAGEAAYEYWKGIVTGWKKIS